MSAEHVAALRLGIAKGVAEARKAGAEEAAVFAALSMALIDLAMEAGLERQELLGAVAHDWDFIERMRAERGRPS